MKVLITLTDVEPAVRLNALLEGAGTQTAVVSPLDDLRGEIKRFKPDLIVLTGALGDPNNLQLVRDQLWNGTAVVGLADVEDPELRERLRMIGMVDVYTKPISADELYLAVRAVMDRKRLTEATGLIGQSRADQRGAAQGGADRAGVEHGDHRGRERNRARSWSRTRSTV